MLVAPILVLTLAALTDPADALPLAPPQAALALAVPPAGALHPNSLSRSLIVVRADGLTHFVRLQVLSLLEVLDADPDRNRLVEPDELAAVQGELAAYLASHYHIGPPGGEPFAAQLVAAELVTHDADALQFEQFVDVERHIAVDRAPAELLVEMTLFLDTSPAHTDLLAVRWQDDSLHETRLWAAQTSASFRADAPPPTTADQELLLGAEHIVFGYDHVAFLLALLVASRRVRALVAVVTAFTLAHSVTLTLAALDVVRLPERPIEIVIAASIAYVGLVNLIRRGPRPLWIEAFVFGLVHGLGFASVLAEFLPAGAGRLRTLVLFNVGIELGQLALVLAVLALLAVARRVVRARSAGAATSAGPPGLVPERVRQAVSVGVLLAGATWFVERLV